MPSNKIYESHIEDLNIEMLNDKGYSYAFGPQVAFDGENPERESHADVILVGRLRDAITKLNPDLPTEAIEETIRRVKDLKSEDIVADNKEFHHMLVEGVRVECQINGKRRGVDVQLLDFEKLENNEFLSVNQFTIVENGKNKRPDIILFVNGLPLVVIELKNPGDENATLENAYTQLQNYKKAIPTIFKYNSILVISDGHEARAGSLTSPYSRFMAWKTQDGKTEDKKIVPELVTMVNGMLDKNVLLDLVKNYTVFENEKREDGNGITTINSIKKIAAYHQYYAVKKAIESTIEASAIDGNRKCGVIWHTQGSGKSLSMVFYAGQVVQKLDNPTIVVITDRNDLDEQLFDTFAACEATLKQTPVKAKNRNDLKKLLKVNSGGVVFTTIQKFFPDDENEEFDLLSDRKNIVVIADEAHRTQYGLAAKTRYKTDEAGKEIGSEIKYGYAKYLRDAIPNASFIGFTGTPVESEDRSTKNVFGEYIDVYDISQAIQDGSTVKIFYESRLVRVDFKDGAKEKIDLAVEEITENEEATASEKAKAKWAQVEAIVGQKDRVAEIAKDIINHYEARSSAINNGKAMIVAMSRRIAVELYSEIVKIKPEWHSEDLDKGVIKVVMTSSSSDPESWQMHNTKKEERKRLARRLKDEDDELKIVIVRDMWLTGFDAPCLKTMYIDKPMQGHNLMQAIARVNRVYGEVEGGLIVDYIGIAQDLKKAIAIYTKSGGKDQPVFDEADAITVMEEKFEIVSQMYHDFDYQKYFTVDTAGKLRLILEAEDFILGLHDGKNRYISQVDLLSKAFALVVTSKEAEKVKKDVAFFQTVKARLVKFEPKGIGRTGREIETAIKQIVDEAVTVKGVVDVFDAAGIKKPEISILSEEFLIEISAMKHKNLAIELLKKLLNDEVKSFKQKNIIKSKKFSEMLENAIKKYQNGLLTSAEIIEEMIGIAKEIKKETGRGEDLGLSDYELAFYDALSNNESAKEVLGKDVLKELAVVLVDKVQKNSSIDWNIRETARAKMRIVIKRLLNKYGYPPDMQKLAIDMVIAQAEMQIRNEI